MKAASLTLWSDGLIMLSKLTTMPTLCRLSLCLIASAGVHGGVVLYDGASQPDSTHDGRSAVVVALVSAADDSSFAVVDTPKDFALQDAALAEPASIDRTPPAEPAAAPSVKSPRATPDKAEVVRQAADVVEGPAEEVVSTEPICMDPGQNLPDHRAEDVSITAEPAAGSRSGTASLPMHADASGPAEESMAADSEVAASEAAKPQGGSLIEAMPDYRNNPLPEYPFIARQKHWQGVVWLLVDVSAEGLVEDVDVERSCGYRALDRSARKTVQRWEFTPAMRAGLPVESQVRIPVRFSLEDS